ncbi:hypothetical protein GGR56DRAFT_676154 [Xylariaceae sp. FL0804]|nr:hypothetical protein GGR56DRAFT_676154 [Xylariaceae sp. FL0804]
MPGPATKQHRRAGVGSEQAPAPAPELLRPLGYKDETRSEMYQLAMYQLDQYRGTLVSARYAIPAKLLVQPPPPRETPLDDAGRQRRRRPLLLLLELKRMVRAAVARVVREHALLRVGIVTGEEEEEEEGKGNGKGKGKGAQPLPAWVGLDVVDLRWHVEWRCYGGDDDDDDDDDDHDNDHDAAGIVSREEEDEKDAAMPDAAAVTTLLDARFEELRSRPGWRVVVLHRRGADYMDVLLVWNHANWDGAGGRIFHEELLRNLNTVTRDAHEELEAEEPHPQPQRQQHQRQEREGDPDDDDEGEIVELASPAGADAGLPQPIEQLAKLPLTARYIAQTYLGIKLSRNRAAARWAPIVADAPPRTELGAFALDGAVLGRVLAACRRHGTTLTALLHGLAFASLASLVPTEAAPAFEAATPVDQRRFVPQTTSGGPPPERTLANYVTETTHTFTPAAAARMRAALAARTKRGGGGEDDKLGPEPTDLVWATAADVRAEIQRKLYRGLKNDAVGLMRFVDDWRAENLATARRPRRLSWIVTNLGALMPDRSDDGERDQGHNNEHRGGDDAAAAASRGGCCRSSSWSIRSAQFALAADVANTAINIAPISVRGRGGGGPLTVTCSWQAGGVVDEAGVGRRLVADLERWLVELAAS